MNTSINFKELYQYAVSIGCDAAENEKMSLNTSFKTGGPCAVRLSPDSAEQIKSIIEKANELCVPFTVLGNGTNVLVPDEGIEKAVIVIGDKSSHISLEGEDTVCFSAGTNLASLCRFALEHSLSGLEFAFGIPGTCGGAIYMNAGAYGGEIRDILTEVTHLTPSAETETVSAQDLALSYRHSAYKNNGCVILFAKVKLKKDTRENIKSRMDDFLNRRKSKQPLEYPSAGSTFKRPEGHFAGALIEQCNLKGKTVGGAQVSEKHAGFVINKGGATSSDILNLIDLIRQTVKSQTGVTLEPEVIILR